MKLSRMIYCAALALGVVSCGQEPVVEIVPPQSEGRLTLEVSSESPLFTSAEGADGAVLFRSRGGEVVLDVVTNQDEWSYDVAEGGEWLEVESNDFFLTLKAEANKTEASRTAEILIRADKDPVAACFELIVTQNHAGVPEIALESGELRVKAHTELVQIVAVECNQDDWSFDVTCPWLLVEKCDEGLRLTADDNENREARTTEVVLLSGEGSEVVSDVLRVSQDGDAFIVLSSQNVAVDDRGGQRSVIITTNPELEWDIESDGSSWFTATKGENEIIVTVEPTADGLERVGVLTVTVGEEDNNYTTTMKVHQIGSDTAELIYEVEIFEPDYELVAAPVLTTSTGGSITVDWGDGSEPETFEARRGSHIYKTPGLYTISITGEAKSLEFSDGEGFCPELKNIISWGTLGLTNAADMCLGCNNLESIPNDVAGSFSKVKSFLGAFSCCESLREIPEGLFRYATVAKNFEDCFSHSGSISKIPADLFANCVAAERFIYTFYGTGTGYVITNSTLSNFEEVRDMVKVGKLTEIPAGLFRNCPNALRFEYVFGATAIEEVPAEIFANNTLATIFTGAFSACVNLKSVAPEFMTKAVSATDIKYMFAGCESLVDLPLGMFKNNSAVTNLEYIFYKTGVKKLSAGLFEGLSGVKTVGAVFQGCESLSEIEEGLFDGLTAVKSFRYCFADCTSLRSVPEGLFRGLSTAYEFTHTFDGSAIESVPAGLFADARDYSSADFTYMFADCKNLKTVPAELFNTFTTVTSPGFKNLFSHSGLEVVPEGLFSANVKVSTGFESVFEYSDALKTIEGPIFPETTTVTTMNYAFCDCKALESIPEGLFDCFSTAKIKFNSTFAGCVSLKTLPDELFAANTQATQFSECFADCTALESVPANLFGSKEKTTTVKGLFLGCKSLKAIPSGLFAQMPAITYFEATFAECAALEEVPADLFAAIGTKTSSISFAECFADCTSLKSVPATLFDTVRRINYIDSCFEGCTSLEGESPYTIIVAEDGTEQKVHLYERTKGTDFPIVPSSTSAHKGCFSGCTKLSDYDNIPSSWKTN